MAQVASGGQAQGGTAVKLHPSAGQQTPDRANGSTRNFNVRQGTGGQAQGGAAQVVHH